MKASGMPNKVPIKLTTLSKSFIVINAMMERPTIRQLDIIFRRIPLVLLLSPAFSDDSSLSIATHAISNAGKFCSGNVSTTARLYAS